MYKDINKRNEYMKKYNKENYHYFKKYGICPRCGINKPVGNYVLCPECLYKKTIRCINKTKKQKIESLEWEKLNRQKKKEIGICSNCSNPVVPGKTRCQYHLNKQREYTKKCRSKCRKYKEKLDGICLYCDKPVVDGKKMCKSHYDDAVKRARYASQFTSWRKGGKCEKE